MPDKAALSLKNEMGECPHEHRCPLSIVSISSRQPTFIPTSMRSERRLIDVKTAHPPIPQEGPKRM